jgi:hypothetical protein
MARLNPILDGVARRYQSQRALLGGLLLAPIFSTPLQSAKYYAMDEKWLTRIPDNIRRAPGAPHAELPQLEPSNDQYYCDNYGIKAVVTDERRANYTNTFDADRNAVENNSEVQAVLQEKRIHAKATSISATSSPSTKWNQAGSKPKADFLAAKAAVEANSFGFQVNTLLISGDVADVLVDHADVKENVKYVTGGNITEEQLRIYFGVERLIVARGFANTAAGGQDPVAGRIWGDSVILAYVNPRASSDWEAPTFMRSMRWASPQVAGMESWRDSDRKSDMHSMDQYLDEKLTGELLGYHLSNVLA